MSRMYDRLLAASIVERCAHNEPQIPESITIRRQPRYPTIPAVSSAEAEVCWWDHLTEHYMDHQSRPQWVLMRGGHSEFISTYHCPDCQRYGRAFEAHQREGGSISEELGAIWK